MNSLMSRGEVAVRPQERQRKEEKSEEWCEVAAVGSDDPYVPVEDEAGEDRDEEEEEAGMRKCVRMQDPKLPSKTEVEEHNITHLPFRSWCRHCVRGRGKEMPPYRSTEDPVMHEFHFDWAFPW